MSISTAIGILLDRAERSGAALSVYDENDRLLAANRRQSEIYQFVDFARRPTFDELVWKCIEHRKLADGTVYRNPQHWISTAAAFRGFSEFSQFITHHSDGRTLLVCHERIRDSSNWWYQARIDITAEMKRRVRDGDDRLDSASWTTAFTPLTRNSFVPIGNVLAAIPAAAALVVDRGKILDANPAFLKMLVAADGFINVGGRVALHDAAEQADFQRRLSRFFQGPESGTTIPLRVSRRDGGEPYLATLSALPGDEEQNADAVPLALLTVVDCSILPTIDPRTLATFLQITLAEADVACLLGAGRTVEDIARERGASRQTVYNQVKSILAKTGFNNQADIARRVVGLSSVFGRRT
ncbi:helix-turn-helix transcriptional regulator [Azospirillum halopraeferens]|uniref:helix-turn-helix transcriptional regulator n=1 Tax=Azospirillum halopraeferens TaxID=34010 RepID=UPI000491ED8D|nr:PAS domain-containing protein [Azospirillum halopraeferens]